MYLNCKTYYSFKYGTFSTEELVQTAADKGVTALVLTNINSTYDAWDFVKHCREKNIKPLLGAEIRNGDALVFILIAGNNRGLASIHRFITEHLISEKSFPDIMPADGNVADWYVIYPLTGKQPEQLLSHEKIGIRPSQINRLFGVDWKLHQDKFVILQPVTIQDAEHFYAHCLLRAIDKNKLLSKLEKEECCERDETFLAPAELLHYFRQYPWIVMNTYRLMDACTIEMDFRKDKTKQVFGGSQKDDRILLEKLATSGLIRRYGRKNKAAIERMKSELKIIFEMGFTAYFLINHDIVQYAQAQGYYHVGRDRKSVV